MTRSQAIAFSKIHEGGLYYDVFNNRQIQVETINRSAKTAYCKTLEEVSEDGEAWHVVEDWQHFAFSELAKFESVA